MVGRGFLFFRFHLLELMVAYQPAGLNWVGLAGGKRGMRRRRGDNASVVFSSDGAVFSTTTDCLEGDEPRG